MTHPADDVLAALIVGDSDLGGSAHTDPQVAEHLAQCPRCQGVVAELAHVEMLLGDPQVYNLPGPSDRVWPAIAAHVRGDARGIPDPSSARRRPRAPRGWLAAAAATVLLVGGYAAGRLATRPEPAPAPPVVAAATLSSMDGARRLGEAHVLSTANGLSLHVHVDTALPPPPSGYVEVWLINSDLTRMISVGALSAGPETELVVPATAIEAGYRIVDLSNERYDDRPAHSGDSIMRGRLS